MSVNGFDVCAQNTRTHTSRHIHTKKEDTKTNMTKTLRIGTCVYYVSVVVFLSTGSMCRFSFVFIAVNDGGKTSRTAYDDDSAARA